MSGLGDTPLFLFVGRSHPSPRRSFEVLPLGLALLLLLPVSQFNPPGSPVASGLVLLLCSAATTLGHCGAMVAVDCGGVNPPWACKCAATPSFECARTERNMRSEA